MIQDYAYILCSAKKIRLACGLSGQEIDILPLVVRFKIDHEFHYMHGSGDNLYGAVFNAFYKLKGANRLIVERFEIMEEKVGDSRTFKSKLVYAIKGVTKEASGVGQDHIDALLCALCNGLNANEFAKITYN
jgi:hypothetical protein